MSYIPNIRLKESGYDTDKLEGENKAFLSGYDTAIENILSLSENLDIYTAESLVIHYLDEHDDEADKVFNIIRDWIERDRNFVGVSLLDSQANETGDYKSRTINEYNQLSTRLNKLDTLIKKAEACELGFTLNCPLELLKEQAEAMRQYKTILEKRAKIENINI